MWHCAHLAFVPQCPNLENKPTWPMLSKKLSKSFHHGGLLITPFQEPESKDLPLPVTLVQGGQSRLLQKPESGRGF